MIEVCAGGLSTYSRCISVPLCSRPPKISLGKVLRGVFGEPYRSCTGYTLRGVDRLSRWHGTIGQVFFYLQRFRE